MHALLKPTHQRCTDEESANDILTSSEQPKLTKELINIIQDSHLKSFDWKLGGPKTAIKFLDRDSVEYCLLKASQGDALQKAMAELTLENALKLFDPVWGGVYQYSTHNWLMPHHSKTMSNQAGFLRIYVMAYALLQDDRYLHAAYAIRDYLKYFLLSECGGFYSGQSNFVNAIKPLDYYALKDHQRREYGIPSIWKSRYARENGWAIESLAYLYEFSDDNESLQLALDAATWVVKHRAFIDGGFRHDRQNQQGPYLADTLAMGRALLQLYKVTADEQWLHRAANAADFIIMYFKQPGGGFMTHAQENHKETCLQIDENISLMRFANTLTYYSELKRHRGIAKHCLRYLSRKSVCTARDDETGILLAYDEYSTTPFQIIIHGNHQNPQVKEFFTIARKYPRNYKTLHLVEDDEYSNQQSPSPFVEIIQDDRQTLTIRSALEMMTALRKFS